MKNPVLFKYPYTNKKGRSSMLSKDNTTTILNLEDVIITDTKNVSDELHIYLELPRREHICPCCGERTDKIHDYREQIIKDIPLGRTTLLHLRKRRYRCSCGKRFFEENRFLPRYYRLTLRLFAQIINSFHDTLSAKEIASRFNVSNSTALRYFDTVGAPVSSLPRVLSIDEYKGNADRQKYQVITTDPEHLRVLDILPNRYENTLINYFRQFPDRDKVEYFVIDMNKHFREVGKSCFKNAKIVADKYHVVRQASWAMENVRKNEQKKFGKQHRLFFKHSRYLLFKPNERLTDEEKTSLAIMLEIAPRLAKAYNLRNQFLKVMQAKSSLEGKKLLNCWLFDAEKEDLPEYVNCISAYRNWYEEILNALDVHWTNGFTEGCNNKTKVLKRVCYGMQNFQRSRKRILFCQK